MSQLNDKTLQVLKISLYPGVWLHVDMAFPSHSGERATGYGVALLNTLFGQFSNSKLLKDSRALSGSNIKK